jgi:Grx4 family monothiol glutaredoxin
MTSTVKLTELPTKSDFDDTIGALPADTLAVIYFHAPWASPCKQMSVVLETLASTYPTTSPPKIAFYSIHAEEMPEVSEMYDVTAVPFVVLQRGGNILESISGSDAGKVRNAVEKHSGAGVNTNGATSANLPPPQTVTKAQSSTNGISEDEVERLRALQAKEAAQKSQAASTDTANVDKDAPLTDALRERLAELVNAAPVMLFMKGAPSAPQCGFSRKVVGLLREKGVRYGFFNILADLEVREGLKKYADWPTFPQLWVDGDLVGGLDIVQEEFENDPNFLDRYSVNSKPAPQTDSNATAAAEGA